MQFVKKSVSANSSELTLLGVKTDKKVMYPFGVASSCRRQQVVEYVVEGKAWLCVMPYIARFRNQAFLAELAKKLHFAASLQEAFEVVGNFRYATYASRKAAQAAKKELEAKLKLENQARISAMSFERNYLPVIYCASVAFSPEGFEMLVAKTVLYANSIGLDYTKGSLIKAAYDGKNKFAKEIKRVQKSVDEAKERAKINAKFFKWQTALYRQFFKEAVNAHKGKISEKATGVGASMFAPNDYKSFEGALKKMGVTATETLWKHYNEEDRNFAQFLYKRRVAIEENMAARTEAKAKFLEEKVARLNKRAERLAKNEQEKLKRMQRKIVKLQSKKPAPLTVWNVAKVEEQPRKMPAAPKVEVKVDLKACLREKVKSLALWRKPKVIQAVKESLPAEKIVQHHVNELRVQKHQHTCFVCKSVYEHVHKMRFENHRQVEGQCPNPVCRLFHNGNNPTNSTLVKVNKAYETKQKIVDLKSKVKVAAKACKEIIQRTEAQKTIHEHKCWVCKRRYIHNARCTERDYYKYNCPYAGCARYHNGLNPCKAIERKPDQPIEEQFKEFWKAAKAKASEAPPPKVVLGAAKPTVIKAVEKKEQTAPKQAVAMATKPTVVKAVEKKELVAPKKPAVKAVTGPTPAPKPQRIKRLNTKAKEVNYPLDSDFAVKKNDKGEIFVESADFVCMHSVSDDFNTEGKVLNNDIISSYNLGVITSTVSVGVKFSQSQPEHAYNVSDNMVEYENVFQGKQYSGMYMTINSDFDYVSGTPVFNTRGEVCSLITCRRGRDYVLVSQTAQTTTLLASSIRLSLKKVALATLSIVLLSGVQSAPANKKVRATDLPGEVVAIDFSRNAQAIRTKVEFLQEYKKSRSPQVAEQYFTKYQVDLTTKNQEQLTKLENEINSIDIDIRQMSDYLNSLKNNSDAIARQVKNLDAQQVANRAHWTVQIINMIEAESGRLVSSYNELEALVKYWHNVVKVLQNNNIEGVEELTLKLKEAEMMQSTWKNKSVQIEQLQNELKSMQERLTSLIVKAKSIKSQLSSAVATLSLSMTALKKMEEQLLVATRLLNTVRSQIEYQNDEVNYNQMTERDLSFDIEAYNQQLKNTLDAQSKLSTIVSELSRNVYSNVTIPKELVALPTSIQCSLEYYLNDLGQNKSYYNGPNRIVFSNRVLEISVSNKDDIQCLVSNITAYAGCSNIIHDSNCGSSSYENGIHYIRDACANVSVFERTISSKFQSVELNINIFSLVKYCGVIAVAVFIWDKFGNLALFTYVLIMASNGVLSECTIDGKVLQLTSLEGSDTKPVYKVYTNMYKGGCIHAANLTIMFKDIVVEQAYNKIGFIPVDVKMQYASNYSCPGVDPIWNTFENQCNKQANVISVFRKTESFNTMWSGTSCGANGQVRMGHCFMLTSSDKVSVYQKKAITPKSSVRVTIDYYNIKTEHVMTDEINTLNYKISGIIHSVSGITSPEYIFKYKGQFLTSQQIMSIVDTCWCKDEKCSRFRDNSCLQLRVSQNGVSIEHTIRLNPFASWLNTSMIVSNPDVSFSENSSSALITQEKTVIELYVEPKPLSMIVSWCKELEFSIQETQQGEESNFKYATVTFENLKETDCIVNMNCQYCQLITGLVYKVKNNEFLVKILCGSLTPTTCTISTPLKEQEIVINNLMKNYKLELSYAYDTIKGVIEKTGVKFEIDSYKNNVSGFFTGIIKIFGGLTAYIALACGTVISINLYSQGYNKLAVAVIFFSVIPIIRGEPVEPSSSSAQQMFMTVTGTLMTSMLAIVYICQVGPVREVFKALLNVTFGFVKAVCIIKSSVYALDKAQNLGAELLPLVITCRKFATDAINLLNKIRMDEDEAYNFLYYAIQVTITSICYQNTYLMVGLALYKSSHAIRSLIHTLFHDTEIIECEIRCPITDVIARNWPQPISKSCNKHVYQGFVHPVSALKYHSRYILDIKDIFEEYSGEEFINKALVWKGKNVCHISCVQNTIISARHAFYNVKGAKIVNDLIVYGPNQDTVAETLISKKCCIEMLELKFKPGDSGMCIALNDMFYIHSGVAGNKNCCAIHHQCTKYHSDKPKKLELKQSNSCGAVVKCVKTKLADGSVKELIVHHGVASGKINAEVTHKEIPKSIIKTSKEVALKKQVKQELFAGFVRAVFKKHNITIKIKFVNNKTNTYLIFVDSVPENIKDQVIAECYKHAKLIAENNQFKLPDNKVKAIIAVSDFELEKVRTKLQCSLNQIEGNKQTVAAISTDYKGDLTMKCSSKSQTVDFERIRRNMARLNLVSQARNRESIPVVVDPSAKKSQETVVTLTASQGAVKKAPKVTSDKGPIKYQSGEAEGQQQEEEQIVMPKRDAGIDAWVDFAIDLTGISSISAHIICRIHWLVARGENVPEGIWMFDEEPAMSPVMSEFSQEEILATIQASGLVPESATWTQAMDYIVKTYKVEFTKLPPLEVTAKADLQPFAILENQVVEKNVMETIQLLRDTPITTEWMVIDAPPKSSSSQKFDNAEDNWYNCTDTTFVTKVRGPKSGFGFISKGFHYSAYHVVHKGNLQINFTSDAVCSTIMSPREQIKYSKDFKPTFVSTPDKGDFHVVDLTEEHRVSFQLPRMQTRNLYFAVNFERKEFVTMISLSPSIIDEEFKAGIPINMLQLFDVSINKTIPHIRKLKGWSGSPIFNPEGIPVGIITQSIPKKSQSGEVVRTLVAAEIKPPSIQSNMDLMSGYFEEIYRNMQAGKIPMITAPTGFGKTTLFVFHFSEWFSRKMKKHVNVAVGIPKRYAITELNNYICDFRAKIGMDTFAAVTMRLRNSPDDLNVSSYKCSGPRTKMTINYMTCGSLIRRDLVDFDLIIVDEIHTRNDADILALEWYVQNYAKNKTVSLTATTWESEIYAKIRIGGDAGDRVTDRKLDLWKEHDKTKFCKISCRDKSYAMPLECHKDRTIIFCSTIRECEEVQSEIVEQGHACTVVTSKNRGEITNNIFIAATNCIETGITITKTTNVIDFMQKVEKIADVSENEGAICYETHFERKNISPQEAAQRRGRTGRDCEGIYWVPEGCVSDGIFVEYPESAICQGALAILQNDCVYNDYRYEGKHNDLFIEKLILLHPRYLSTKIRIKGEELYGSNEASKEIFLRNKLKKSYLETIDPIVFYLANFLPPDHLEQLTIELEEAHQFIESASESDYIRKNRETNVVIPEFKELETYSEDFAITSVVAGGMVLGISALIYNVCSVEAGTRRVTSYCAIPRAQFLSRVKSYKYLTADYFVKRDSVIDQVKRHFPTFRTWLSKVISKLESKIPEGRFALGKLKRILAKLEREVNPSPVEEEPEEDQYSEENIIQWIADLITQLEKGGDEAIKITSLLAAMGVTGVCIEEISKYFGDILPTAMVACAGVFLSQNMPSYLYGSSAGVVLLINFLKNAYTRADPELTKGGALVTGIAVAPLAFATFKKMWHGEETQKLIVERLSKAANISVTPNITVQQYPPPVESGLYSNWAGKALYGSGSYDTGYSLAKSIINIIDSEKSLKENWVNVVTASLCAIKTVKSIEPQTVVAACVTAGAHMVYKVCLHSIRYTRLGMGGDIRNENIAAQANRLGNEEMESSIRMVERIYKAAHVAVGCALNPSAIVSTIVKVVAEVVKEADPNFSTDKILDICGETVCQSPIVVLISSMYDIFQAATQAADSWIYNRIHSAEQYSSHWDSVKSTIVDCAKAFGSGCSKIACEAAIAIAKAFKKIFDWIASIVRGMKNTLEEITDRVADRVLSSITPNFVVEYLLRKGKGHTKDKVVPSGETNDLREIRSVFVRYGLINVVNMIDKKVRENFFSTVFYDMSMSIDEHRVVNALLETELVNDPNEWGRLVGYNRSAGANCYTLSRSEAVLELRKYFHYVESLTNDVITKDYNIYNKKDIMVFITSGSCFQLLWVKPKIGTWQIIEIANKAGLADYRLYLPEVTDRVPYCKAVSTTHIKDVVNAIVQCSKGKKVHNRIAPKISFTNPMSLVPYMMLPNELAEKLDLIKPTLFKRTRIDYYSEFLLEDSEIPKWIHSHYQIKATHVSTDLVQAGDARKLDIALPSVSVAPLDEKVFTRSSRVSLWGCLDCSYSVCLLFRLFNATESLQEKATIIHLVTGHTVTYKVGESSYKQVTRFRTCNCHTLITVEDDSIIFKQTILCENKVLHNLRFSADVSYVPVKYKKDIMDPMQIPELKDSTLMFVASMVLPKLRLRIASEPVYNDVGIRIHARVNDSIIEGDIGALKCDAEVIRIVKDCPQSSISELLLSQQVDMSSWIVFDTSEYFYLRDCVGLALWCTGHSTVANYNIVPANPDSAKKYKCLQNIKKRISLVCSGTVENININSDEIPVVLSSNVGEVTQVEYFDLAQVLEESCFIALAQSETVVKAVACKQKCATGTTSALIKPQYRAAISRFLSARDPKELNTKERKALRTLIKKEFQDMSWMQITDMLTDTRKCVKEKPSFTEKVKSVLSVRPAGPTLSNYDILLSQVNVSPCRLEDAVSIYRECLSDQLAVDISHAKLKLAAYEVLTRIENISNEDIARVMNNIEKAKDELVFRLLSIATGISFQMIIPAEYNSTKMVTHFSEGVATKNRVRLTGMILTAFMNGTCFKLQQQDVCMNKLRARAIDPYPIDDDGKLKTDALLRINNSLKKSGSEIATLIERIYGPMKYPRFYQTFVVPPDILNEMRELEARLSGETISQYAIWRKDAFLLDVPLKHGKLEIDALVAITYMTTVAPFAASLYRGKNKGVRECLRQLADEYTNLAALGAKNKEQELLAAFARPVPQPKAGPHMKHFRGQWISSMRRIILNENGVVEEEEPIPTAPPEIDMSSSESYCLDGLFDRFIRAKPYHGWVNRTQILERVEVSANALAIQQAEKIAIAPYQERIAMAQERDLLPAEMYSIVHFDRCSKRALCPIYYERLYNLDEKILGVKESVEEFKAKRSVPVGLPIKPFTKVDKIPYAVTVSDQGLQALNDSIGHVKGEAWQALKRYNREYLPKTYEYDAISRGYYKAQAIDRDLGIFKTSQNIADLTCGAGGFVQWAITSHDQKLKRRIVYNSLLLPGHAVPREELLRQSVQKVKNVEIHKVKTDTNGDIRYREILEVYKQFALNLPFDVVIADCGESHTDLERESKWQLVDHPIAGVTKESIAEKVHARTFADALVNYLVCLKSGGTLLVKMMGFTHHTSEISMKYTKYFNGVVLYKMPTASFQSREWYLCLYGFDKEKYSREHNWDADNMNWRQNNQSTVAVIIPPLHGKKNLAKANTNITAVPFGTDISSFLKKHQDCKVIATSDEEGVKSAGINIVARIALPEQQLRVNAEKRKWIRKEADIEGALTTRLQKLREWETNLEKITLCQSEQAMRRAIENLTRIAKTGSHVDCVDVTNLIQHAKYIYVQKLQEYTKWVKQAYKKWKKSPASEKQAVKEAVIIPACGGKTVVAKTYERIDDIDLYNAHDVSKRRYKAITSGDWEHYDKHISEEYVKKQFLHKDNQSSLILLDRPEIASKSGIKIRCILLPSEELHELNVRRRLNYDQTGAGYAKQNYERLRKMANKYPIVRFNRYEDLIDNLKRFTNLGWVRSEQNDFEIPMYYRKWMTPEKHWRFPKEMEYDPGFFQVKRTSDEWKIDKSFELNGVTYNSHMEERVRMIMDVAKQSGYKQYPATGIFDNITEFCRLSFPQKFGHEKHNANKIINSCMFNVFGMDYMNSTFGHTQCTPDHLHAAWKKRLDIMPVEPSINDAKVLWRAAQCHVTPEYNKIANGPDSKKFKPWTYEEAIKHINNQGKGGHFDSYLNNAEAVEDPAFKKRVLKLIADMSKGSPSPTYQTVRDKRETKAKKNITNDGLIDCPDEWNPNLKEYERLNSSEKKVRREARLQWLKEHSNLAPRNIRFADQAQRIADLMILGPMQDHHVNKGKLYMGTSTGTPLWDLGTMTKAIHDFYSHHTEQEYINCKDDPYIKAKIYSEQHKANKNAAKNKALIRTLIASGDFSGWDGTVSLTDLAILHQSYERLYSSKHHLLLKTRFEMWMWSIVITDHGNVLLCQGQRSSGDQDTSHGNTKLNDVYHTAATAEALGITVEEASTTIGEIDYKTINGHKNTYYVRRISHVADGDDNIHFGSEKDIRLLDKNGSLFLERCGKKIRCGTRPGYSLTDKFEKMEFCSHQYVRVRLGNVAGKPIGECNISDRPPIFNIKVEEHRIPEAWVETYKETQKQMAKQLSEWTDANVWGLSHQHDVERKIGLRVKYLPIRPLPNILGKLNYTLKQATNVIDLRRDYGTDKKSERFAKKNEYAIEITRGKLLAYMLNYMHLESVRTTVTTIMSVIGEGTCNWEELNKRYSVPKIFDNMHSAIKSVFGVDNLTEVEVISHHWDRQQLKNVAHNTRMTREDLKVHDKTVCPQNLRDLRMMLDDWANKFTFEEGIKRDENIFRKGEITRQLPVHRFLSFAAIMGVFSPTAVQHREPALSKRQVYFSNVSLTSVKGQDSILREAKKEARKNIARVCSYSKGAKTIVISKFKKGDDVQALIQDTVEVLKQQDRCSEETIHTELNIPSGLLDKTRVVKTFRNFYKKFSVK